MPKKLSNRKPSSARIAELLDPLSGEQAAEIGRLAPLGLDGRRQDEEREFKRVLQSRFGFSEEEAHQIMVYMR
jgi:uncharacterized tellurite resistance protein B-like protein